VNPAAEALTLMPTNAPEDDTCEFGCVFPDRSAAMAEVVARWHDDAHAGAFSTCSEQPCDAVRRL
jgi:hypothetical protein